MIINSDDFKKIYEFVNTLKLDNCIKFAKDSDGTMVIIGQDSYTSFTISSEIKWDLDINSFCIKIPNITFFEGDINIFFDPQKENIIFNNMSVFSSVLNNVNDFYNSDLSFNNKDFNLEKSTLNMCDLEETLSILKKLSCNISLNSDNFTSGIYVDSDSMFTTDKITACWFHNSIFPSIDYSAVIDGSIIHLIDKVKNFEPDNFSIYLEKDKNIIISFKSDSFNYICIKSLLNYNYPNFKNVFSKYTFDVSLMINREEFEDIIMNILKFDNKCSGILLEINPTDKIITVFSTSFDNVKSINFKIPFTVEKGDIFYKVIKVNPIHMKNNIGNSKSFIMNVSKEENKPIQIISTDYFENYIHTMSI